jgi:repressor LexA
MTKKNILGPVIKDLRKSKNLTQGDLSKLTGIAQNTISNHENQNRTLDEQDIRSYADALNVTPQHLYSLLSNDSSTNDITPIYNQLNSDNKIILYDQAKKMLNQQNGIVYLDEPKQDYAVAKKTVPYSISKQSHELEILGSVSAGTGEYLDDNAQRETIQYFGNVPVHDYAVKVNGDSMTPLFEDGQIIFVKANTTDFINGQIVIANVNGEAYVKKIELNENGAFLISLNAKYKPIEITDNSELQIKGTVIL